MRKIRIPILIFQAEWDHMVKNSAHIRFLTGTKHTALMQIKGSRHEIFHAGEEQRKEYYEALFLFLEQKCYQSEGIKRKVEEANERKKEAREILDFI